jgi:hypothetical protein
MRLLLKTAALLVLMLVLGQADARQKGKLDEIQNAYAAAIRWGDFEGAVNFLDPAYLQEHPVGEFELSRFEQIQVSGYRDMNTSVEPDGTVVRAVEVRIINKHTQAERTVRYRERWRYDEEAKRWWVVGGLPDFWKGE